MAHETGFHRIIEHIRHNPIKLSIIPHPMVITFRFPERSLALKEFIRLSRREPLERFHDSRQRRMLADEK